MVALINSELYESLEGHRKGKRYSPHAAEIWLPYLDWLACGNNDDKYAEEFVKSVKDTVEDEIADAVIRILDFTHGWNIPVLERYYRKESTGNYGEDLLRLNHYVLTAYHDDKPGFDWGYCLSAIIEFCKWYNIDMITHVYWKMRYNATRPYKHNKTY